MKYYTLLTMLRWKFAYVFLV